MKLPLYKSNPTYIGMTKSNLGPKVLLKKLDWQAMQLHSTLKRVVVIKKF